MTDRRLLPLAVALIMACNPAAPLLLPTIDSGTSIDGTADRPVATDASDAGPVDAPVSGDIPVIDVAVVDVPVVPDVPSVMDVVPTVDIPDVPLVIDSGTCPSGMVLIPGGTFTMGEVDPASHFAQPPHQVTLSAFCLDRTEVTVAAYSACTAPGCTAPGTGGSCNWGVSGRGNHPVTCVDWYVSSAFCRWRDAQLPTEAQWEYAARGTDGRIYPWGNDAPAAQVCWGGAGTRSSTCPVGSFPAANSPFGVSDLSGSVWEWTADWYSPYGPASSNPILDPTGPASGTQRVTRGGAWNDTVPNGLRGPYRNSARPTDRDAFAGFRCARAPL